MRVMCRAGNRPEITVNTLFKCYKSCFGRFSGERFFSYYYFKKNKNALKSADKHNNSKHWQFTNTCLKCPLPLLAKCEESVTLSGGINPVNEQRNDIIGSGLAYSSCDYNHLITRLSDKG